MEKKKKRLNYKSADLAHRYDNRNQKFNNFTLTPSSNAGMSVYQSGHKSYCEPGFHTTLATYDHYIIHYILNGKGTYHAPSRSYPVKKGDLFLIKPYESIHYIADLKEPWSYYWVGFNGHDALKQVKLCGFSNHSLVRSYTYDNQLEEVLRQLAYPQLTATAREYELLSNLYRMFALLIQTQEHHPVSKSEQYLLQAIEYIQQNYMLSDMKISNIARFLNIDRTYLYRIFYDAFQQSVQEYVLDFRLQKAKSLLTYSDHSIRLISSSCGFENQSYFSNIFKKRCGQTPLQYRKTSSPQT